MMPGDNERYQKLYARARVWYEAKQLSGKSERELETMIAERETK